jgi:hypothetical protein
MDRIIVFGPKSNDTYGQIQDWCRPGKTFTLLTRHGTRYAAGGGGFGGLGGTIGEPFRLWPPGGRVRGHHPTPRGVLR